AKTRYALLCLSIIAQAGTPAFAQEVVSFASADRDKPTRLNGFASTVLHRAHEGSCCGWRRHADHRLPWGAPLVRFTESTCTLSC
ncbi:MAG: hypothetical protein ACE5LB_07725, partial [Acidiferrobacterales bacterium]